MSFSMENVSILKMRKNERIREIFAWLSDDYRLTDQVSTALYIYVDTILKTRGYRYISLATFRNEVDNMLQQHCNKVAVLITKDDVLKAEPYIIADIKRAISAGGLKYVKYDADGSAEIDHIATVLLNREIEKNNSTRVARKSENAFGTRMSKADMEKFLTELEVI